MVLFHRKCMFFNDFGFWHAMCILGQAVDACRVFISLGLAGAFYHKENQQEENNMYVVVKKGTRAPVIAEEETMTAAEISILELVELHKHFEISLDINDFEVLSMSEKEIEHARS